MKKYDIIDARTGELYLTSIKLDTFKDFTKFIQLFFDNYRLNIIVVAIGDGRQISNDWIEIDTVDAEFGTHVPLNQLDIEIKQEDFKECM